MLEADKVEWIHAPIGSIYCLKGNSFYTIKFLHAYRPLQLYGTLKYAYECVYVF